MRRRDFTTAFSLTVISSFLACGTAFAADADPSLDQMWTDPGVSEKKAAGASSDAATERSTAAATGSAPLCSVDALKQSALIKTGGWPGIGPFKSDGNDYVDAGQNRLKIESEKDKITSAELRLNNQNKNTAIFNLEMSADFLLESLGAKEARISDFNGQLEKSRVQLLQSSEAKPLNLSAGTYLVYMHPEQDKSAADKYSFIIKVSGKDASSDLVKHHAAGAGEPETPTAVASSTPESDTRGKQTDSTENGWETTKPAATTKTTKTTSNNTSIASPPGLSFGIETPKTMASTTTKIATATPTRNTTSTTTKPPVTTDNSTTDDSGATSETSTQATPTTLKDTFREVIFNWQKLKKVAVRQRDTSELSTVLSGRALVRQTDAIKWLQANKKYYDMNPRSVVVDRFNELTKGQKYAVYAQVKESSKYMDEPTGQVIKDSEDTYNVNYTIEKSGDKWLISDSAIVTQPNKTKTK